MLRHGYVPKSLRDCILQPIPKPGKDPSSSDNYRSIALAPTLSKVFERCILIQFHAAFVTSSLQFGFKPGVSTDLCTGLIKNVTASYCHKDTPVYGCFLDASKAFDRFDHSLLFKKLLKRNLPSTVVRTLLSWYSDQSVMVLWDKTISTDFSISNGVRQGGVLSPILFTVYIDELLQQLEQLGVGCFWNHHFVGAVCYADDIALLAPSPSALRLMLMKCSCFAESHSLLFNAKKTQLIKFSCCRTDESVELTFCGDQLKLNKSVLHLGHILSSDLSDDEDIVAKRKDLCRKANCMLSIFSSCDYLTKIKLFQSFCLSLYGCALWKASSRQLRSLEVTFNNILRKIWVLPRRCHTSIVHLVSSLHSLFNVVIERSQKVISQALKQPSSLLADVFGESQFLAYTSFGYNTLYGSRHWKTYREADCLCANFIRDARLCPIENRCLELEILYMCTA